MDANDLKLVKEHIPAITVGTRNSDYLTDNDRDEVQINAALLQVSLTGGTVLVKVGNYRISAPIVIRSNTRLEFEKGATITLTAGADCNMLTDISHYTNDLAVPSLVNNITVIGGIWDRGSVGGLYNAGNSFLLGGNKVHIDGCEFRSTGGKFAVLIQNCINFTIENIYMHNTFSDGIHVQGTSQFGLIRNIYGRTGDDMVALVNRDSPNYNFGNEGDITDIVIKDIFPNGQSYANVIRLTSGSNDDTTPLSLNRIHISNLIGVIADGMAHIVTIGDYTTFGITSGGDIDNIIIENVDVYNPIGGIPVVVVVSLASARTYGTITMKNIHVNGRYTYVCYVSKAVVHTINIDSVYGFPDSSLTAIFGFAPGITGTNVGRLRLNNVELFQGDGLFGSVIQTTNSTALLGEVFINNMYVDHFTYLADIISDTAFYLSNIHLLRNTGIFKLASPSVTVVNGCTGLVVQTVAHSITSTATLEVKSYNYPIDVSNARLVKNTGNMAYNTNAGLTCGIGAVGYNGAAWYNSLSGATY